MGLALPAGKPGPAFSLSGPTGLAGPSPGLGMGVGKGPLHQASKGMGDGKETSGKAMGNEWLQG